MFPCRNKRGLPSGSQRRAAWIWGFQDAPGRSCGLPDRAVELMVLYGRVERITWKKCFVNTLSQKKIENMKNSLKFIIQK